MTINPQKTNKFTVVDESRRMVVETPSSDGELKLEKLKTSGGLSSSRPGVTQITKAAEQGEVTTTSVASLQIKQLVTDKSEGEIGNPGLAMRVKHQEMLASYQQSIVESSFEFAHQEIKKTNPSSLKNRIKIQSIRKLNFRVTAFLYDFYNPDIWQDIFFSYIDNDFDDQPAEFFFSGFQPLFYR
jgi:hypothetical protein